MFEDTVLLQQSIGHAGYAAGQSEDGARRQAAQRFMHLHFEALVQRMVGALTGRRSRLRSLHSDVQQAQVQSRRYAGLQSVPLRAIQGSEGRTTDFDGAFRPLRLHNQDRWVSVAAAQRRGVVLPPVDLVQMGEVYYVRDGHHRISVARVLGQATIDAQVTMWRARGE